MKTLKSLLCSALALIMVLSLFAGATAYADGLDELEEQTIILATFTSSTNVEAAAFEYIAEQLPLRTDGKITAEVYTDSLLGGTQELLEQIASKSEQVQMTVSASVCLDMYAPEYNVFSVPYVYPDNDSVRRSWEGPIGEMINEKLAESNMIMMSPMFRGNRQLTANKEVNKPEDLKGVKLRLSENPAFVAVFEAMGAIPTVIAASEIFTSLQTGVVDAQENPIMTNYGRAIWEVQKYTMLTNHYVDWFCVVVDKSWHDSLPADVQDIVDEIIQEASDYASQLTEEKEAAAIKEMEGYGHVYVEVDPAPFHEVALSVLDKFSAEWDPAAYEQMLLDTAG